MDEIGRGGDEPEEVDGGMEKLGHVPRLRCSEAVRDGFEAEKTASHREHRSLTAFGRPVSLLCTSTGSRCAQYHAPFPLIAFARTVMSPSYRFCTARAAISSLVMEGPTASVGALSVAM